MKPLQGPRNVKPPLSIPVPFPPSPSCNFPPSPSPSRTLTCPSSEPASILGAAAESGPARGDMRTQVTVFWKLFSRRSRRPPPTKSQMHSWLPPAVTKSEPASKNTMIKTEES